MITIHHEKETDFSKNGYGAIDNYVMNQEVVWEMNGQFYAYLEYPAFLDKAEYLINKNILRIPVPFMDDQLFRIYRTRKVLGFIQVEARHIFYDLMDNLIEDTNIVGKTGQGAVQQLLGATQYGHRFTGLSDIITVSNARMVRYNPVEALLDDTQSNTFVSRWGGEIVRDNFIIRMAKQMGSDRGVHIQHKKDLLGYEATIDESTVVTRIMPIGFDGLKLPELYIDSPLIDVNNPKIKVIKYDDVKAATGMYAEDEDAIPVAEAYTLLRKYAKEEYSVNHLDEPEMTVKVNFASLHNTKEYAEFSQLQEIQQGDVVKVSVPEEGFEITSRLVAFTSDPLQLNHYTSTTLGNHVFEFTSSSNDTTRMRNEVEQLRESVITAMQSANGKNRNFWGTADPNTLSLNASVGDNYYRENGEETTLYQYVELNGERYWKEIIDTSAVSIVAGKVDEALTAADTAKTEADQARIKADEALAEVGISTDLAQTAKDLATTAQSNASTALTNAQTAVNEAGIAVSQATQAINTADTAKTNAQTALTNAQTALTEAGNAKTTANNLTVRVDDVEAEIELKASQTTVDGLSGTVTNHSTTLTQHANQIASKADSSYVNTIKGTVDTHTTEIAQNATEIASKASAISVNTLTGRVNTAETTITQHAGLIASKASQTEVDTVKGTVSSHTSTLSQHATEISARLTSTQVNSLVDGKGLAKVTYVDNQISATAEGFGVELSKVEGKIDGLEIGSTNLIPNSVSEWVSVTNQTVWDRLVVPVDVAVQGGKTYTYSLEWQKGSFNQRLFLRQTLSDGAFVDSAGDILYGNHQNGRNSMTFTTHPNATLVSLRIRVESVSVNNTYKYRRPKLETGNIATDWSPALEDMLMQNDFTVFKNTYQSTVDGITSELSKTAKITDLSGMVTESYLATNQYTTQGQINTQLVNYLKTTDLNGQIQNTTAYQDIKETSDRYTRVLGSTDAESRTKIAQIAMTDSVYQTTIKNAPLLSNENLIKGSDFRNGFPSNLTSYGQATVTDFYGFDKGLSVVVLTPNSTGWVNAGIRLVVDTIGTYTFSFSGTQNWDKNSPINVFSEKSITGLKTMVRTVQAGITSRRFTITFTTTSDYQVINVRPNSNVNDSNYNNVYYWAPKLERGSEETPWQLASDDLATQSQVTQLSNSWALTLKSGNDIKTQINASTDSIRLASKFIHLSGTSLIDDAVIKSAHIDSLNANKITTGTLNAANVNIVNLNASSISAGTLTAIKLSGPSLNIDLSSGEVNFSKGSIKSANTEWNLSENYMNLEYPSNTGISNRNRIVIGGPNDIKFYDNYNFTSTPNTMLGYMSMARLSSSPDVQMNITVRASDGTGGDYISLRSDGQLYISSLAHVTTSGTANVHSTSGGSIHRVTSALKYKADVQVAEDVIDDAKKILQLKPKSWLDKAELRDTGTSKRYYGFVADDFNQIGLTQVVSYFKGEVDSLNYDRLSIYHNVILSEHEQKIIELENRIEELESQLSA